ncbi:MAG: hypothetical protein IJB79_02825 [Candidatus Gastranaerophilales bacterium]|nr:hypothetical protein [Candidatus Gastranaerophilales bacterium]
MKILPIFINNHKTTLQNKVSFCRVFKNAKNKDIFELSSKKSNETSTKRREELEQKGISNSSISLILELSEHEYQKVIYLLEKGIEADYIHKYIGLNDKQYIKLLKLLKAGVPLYSLETMLKFNDEQFKEALEFHKAGGKPSDINSFYKRFDKKIAKNILDLTKQGIHFDFAKNCATMPTQKNAFIGFKQMGYDDYISSLFANSRTLRSAGKENQESCENIINLIRRNFQKTYDFSLEFCDFIERNQEYKDSAQDFEEYIKQIDFEELFEIAPIVKKYTDCEILNFLETHYLKNTTTFKKEDLIFENLDNFLSENYIDSKTINKLLNSYPLTSRKIGEIPNDWLEKTNNKEKATKEIFALISAFQHHKDTTIFENELSKILNKKASVEKLGAGNYGTAYKIEIENAISTVLKTFHTRDFTFNENWHGRNIEPQVGLFANNNSSKYVKMYFGRVCTKMQRDGFMVTQYLDENITPQKTSESENSKVMMSHSDTFFDNVIEGKIIDFGGIFITTNC